MIAKPSHMLPCDNINTAFITTTKRPNISGSVLSWLLRQLPCQRLQGTREIFVRQVNIYAIKSPNSDVLLPPRDFSN